MSKKDVVATTYHSKWSVNLFTNIVLFFDPEEAIVILNMQQVSRMF